MEGVAASQVLGSWYWWLSVNEGLRLWFQRGETFSRLFWKESFHCDWEISEVPHSYVSVVLSMFYLFLFPAQKDPFGY